MKKDAVSRWLQRFRQLPSPLSCNRALLNMFLAALLALLAFVWAYKTIRIVYGINDDITFRKIASGAISGTPDGHLIYIQYVLGWFISRLFLLDPHVDWYGLTMLGLLYLCLLLILFKALESSPTVRQGLAAIAWALIGFVLLGLQHVVQFQFTTVAGALAGTAIFWLGTSNPQTTRRRVVDSAVCVFLMLSSYMVRSNVFLLSLPFAAIVFLYRNLDWPNRRVHQVGLPMAVLLGVGAVFLVEQLAYRAPAWKAYLRMNEMDTQIFDYCGLPKYADYRDWYQSIGVSETTYKLLLRYTLIPNPSVNSRTYEAIVAQCLEFRGAEAASTSWLHQSDEILSQMFKMMLDGRYTLMNIACIILFALLLGSRRRSFGAIDAFLVLSLVAIHFGVWLYLIANGRFPDRVIWAIFLIEALVLSGIVLEDNSRAGNGRNGAYGLTVSVLAILVAIGVARYQVGVVSAAVQEQADRNKGCERVFGYVARRPSNYYLLSIRSFSYCTRTFTIGADDHLDNYSFTGDWLIYSPLTKANWAVHSLDDIQEDLVERDNIFVLIKPPDSIEFLVDYYRSIHGNVIAAQVDGINTGDHTEGAIIYRLVGVKESTE
jgi:hypothetical protein